MATTRKNKFHLLRSQSKTCPCRKLERIEKENRELKSFLKDFLSPKDDNGNVSTEGCSHHDFDIRFCGFRNNSDDNECPFMACRYWIDNAEFDNCSRLASFASKQDGGWDQEKVAMVMGDSKVKIEEERALRKLRNQIKEGGYKL